MTKITATLLILCSVLQVSEAQRMQGGKYIRVILNIHTMLLLSYEIYIPGTCIHIKGPKGPSSQVVILVVYFESTKTKCQGRKNMK